MKLLRQLLGRATSSFLSVCITFGIVLLAVLFYVQARLPSVTELKDMHMQVPTRIYASNGQLIAQYGYKRRIPVKITDIPPDLVHAVLATEDARYYSHPGVDFIGVARAAVAVVTSGKKVQGASTITMQVARNFFLTRKKTYTRKLNEILLAIKIDHTLSKDKVLELYLNKIYFGHRSYGVAAAAQVYYGKKLDQLTLPEMAMLAGLPQAPSRTNPISSPEHALLRRNHVLQRMLEVGYINQATYEQATKAPITAKYHTQKIAVEASYFAEWIHQQLLQQYGDLVDEQGFQVTTTLNAEMQNSANLALESGLQAYTNRHGYRGPIQHLDPVDSVDSVDSVDLVDPKVKATKAATTINDATAVEQQTAEDVQHDAWLGALASIKPVNDELPAVVTAVQAHSAAILLADETVGTIPWVGLSWAAPAWKDGMVGHKPKKASDVLRPGDVIWVVHNNKQWSLTQAPVVQGAIVSINPQNGAVEAMKGGYDYLVSNFNRVTQAKRQPGSNFKPFIYSAALAKGYTLASVINDAPVVMKDTGENELWRPQNDNLTFNGPTRLRVGLTKSRNLVSIRLLQAITIPYTINYVRRFGFNSDQLPHSLSLALGSASESPLQMARGYAVFANGGYQVKMYGIESIKNQSSAVIYQAQPATACAACLTHAAVKDSDLPSQLAPQVITPQNAYLITQALQGVIQTGTGRQARVLHRSDLAGKTGTTNKQMDAWFSGFNSQLVTTVWVGYDDLTSLHEYGSKAALPIWIDFMRQALAGKPLVTMPEPSGLIQVRIDPGNGLLARPGQGGAIFETFRQAYAPTRYSPAHNPVAMSDGIQQADEQPLF